MSQRDGGRSILSKLVAVVSLTAVAYLAATTIPVLLSTFRFSQAMDAEVLHGSLNEPASVVKRRMVALAKRLELDIPEQQIVVTKSGTQYSIDANYVVPIELVGGFGFDWHVHAHKKGSRRSTALLRD